MADSFKEKMNVGGSEQLFTDLYLTMCQQDSTALLEAIKGAGVDVNFAGPDGETLLMLAVYYAGRCKRVMRPRLIKAIGCLLRNGADVIITDAWGRGAFSTALRSQQKDIVQLLFLHGADFPSRIN